MKNTLRFLLLVLVISLCSRLPADPPRPLQAIASKLEPSRSVVYKVVDGKKLHLHLFEPPGHSATESCGVFLTIHGGGWTGGTARKFYPLADHFARLGMVGISLEYRLANRHSGTTVFDCVKDARSAVRYLRRHADDLGIDPHRIVVSGGSAGGHLAAGTALFDGVDDTNDDVSTSCRPDAMLLYYPVIDTSKQGYGTSKIGEAWRTLSPIDRVKPGLPPTIVFHGTADTVTPYSGAVLFRDRMKAAGNHCDLISHEGGRHGYFIFELPLYESVMNRSSKFLRTQGILD